MEPSRNAPHDVIVAGLGAMGSGVAWQLAARGARVLALDAGQVPHARGSSHGGSRVIRETAFEHPRYVPMVRRAYEMWHALEAGAPAPLMIPTGALYAGMPSASVVTGSRRSAQEHDVPCDEVSAGEIRARWPACAPADGMVGLFEHRGGVLRPEACVAAMIGAASREGACLGMTEAMIDWGAEDGGAWVRTENGRFSARHLVLATGPWLRPVLRGLGVEVWVERVVQHWFAPAGPARDLEPGTLPVYLWEDADGVIFYGFPMIDGAVKCAIHHRGESTTIEAVRREVSPDEVARTHALLQRYVPAAAGPCVRSAVCLYTNTPDGDFLVDRHPRHASVILVSPCSGIGFKFAPMIGEIVADLVEDKRPRFDLGPFSISRFPPVP